MDDLTGFEITKLVELPDPWGIVVVWGLVLPLTYIISSALTNLVLRDFLILKARARLCLLPHLLLSLPPRGLAAGLAPHCFSGLFDSPVCCMHSAWQARVACAGCGVLGKDTAEGC